MSISLFANSQLVKFVKTTNYSAYQNFNSYNIRKIISDKYGFTWIATQDGLYKFDGKAFDFFSNNSIPGKKLSGTDIHDILLTDDEKLLILSGGSSIDALNLKTSKVSHVITLPLKDENEWNIKFFNFFNTLWIGTFSGLKQFNTSTKNINTNIFVPQSTNGKSIEANFIKKDKQNNIWVGYNGFGIVIYNPNSNDTIRTIPLKSLGIDKTIKDFRFNDLCFANDTSACIASTKGLRKIEFNKKYNINLDNSICKYESQLNSVNIECLGLDSKGNIYVGSSIGFYKCNNNLTKFTILKDAKNGKNDDLFMAILSVYIDSKDNIWAGCKEGLAFIKSNDVPFESYYYNSVSNEQNDKLAHVHSLAVYDDQNIFAGLRNGLAIINRQLKNFKVYDKENLYHHIFRSFDGTTIVSRSTGLFSFFRNEFQHLAKKYPEFKGYDNFSINSHLNIGDSIFVLGTENDKGILIWNYIKHNVKNINTKSKPTSIGSDIVNKVYHDINNNVWVLSDNNISILDKNFNKSKFLNFKDNQGITIGPLFALAEAKKFYWLTAYGFGLLQLDSSGKLLKIYNTKDGLCDEGVYEIYSVGDTSLVITTNKGLSVFNIHSKKFLTFYEANGLHSSAFEEACGLQKNGLIYAGGVNGFTIIDPSKIHANNSPPKLYFTHITIETQTGKIDSTNIEIKKINLPNNIMQSIIYFSGINWSNPERTTFSWRILENGKKWSDSSTQNYISLLPLPPGTYHLQVKAANEDGVWSEPKELILVFLPKWYQTWWFYLLIVLTVSAILYALYRYRINQIKKQHEIRKNIATDLHDDLGSTLNSVKVFTNLAISGVKQEESLQQVKDNLTEATMSLRDMIWVLDDSLDTIDELITRLKQFAIPVASASNIEAIIKADSEVNNRQLTKEEKRNLFLICKEAINNSIKYSGASQIDIGITASGKKIQIVVADNGKGFDVDTVKKGYGLKNMQYRAGQIKYSIQLSSIINSGTQIKIMPL